MLKLMFCFVVCIKINPSLQQHKPQPSTTTFVLNQLNQLPSLGAAVTKQSVTNPIKHTITVTKVVHVANSALRGSSTPSSTSIPPSVSTVVPSNRDQVCLWKPWIPSNTTKDRTAQRKTFLLCCTDHIFSLSFFLADSVERPPSDRQCEKQRFKGKQSDGAHEAKTSTEHCSTSCNGNSHRLFTVIWCFFGFFYPLGLSSVFTFCLTNCHNVWFESSPFVEA